MDTATNRTTTTADRARLVRERDRLRAEGEMSGAKLAAKFYQSEHDADRAREALAKLETAAGSARHEWNLHSLGIERGCSALDAELEATAPRAIDAALADVALLKERFRGLVAPVMTVRMSDGSRQADPDSVADNQHAHDRWQTLTDAERQLRAMKFEAHTDAELAKRLEAIRARVDASLYRQVAAA